MLGIIKSIVTTTSAALRKPVTVQYPTQVRRLPARNRGLPLLVWDHQNDEPVCIGCQQCANVCPVACITVAGPVENAHFRPRDHDEEACKAENNGVCVHTSPRRTLPAVSLADSMRFLIDEDRCMRCGMCEEVCPTDQERYGSQKAIVLGTGHLAIQSSVYDRRDNVLDLNGLTYHSRVLGLELNAVMGNKTPRKDVAVNSPEVTGIRLNASLSDTINPPEIPFSLKLKSRILKLYAPVWQMRRKMAGPRDSETWPSLSEMSGRGRGRGR
ncbi:MAG TPA: 4Fe-4S binding protein [Dehalococcoidia bacterium]|nr:4Fe-4S binding protein [Dehalococcoidia bacterium]